MYYILNNQENKIINLDELIEKAIFFKFRDENPNFVFEIENINMNNLVYSDINLKITKNESSNIQQESITSCISITYPVLNHEQTYNSPSCKYTKETTKTVQITTGLSKSTGTESSKETSSTSDMKKNWNINIETEAKIFDYTTKFGISGGEEYGSSKTNTFLEKINLSNTFDLSSNNINEKKTIEEIEFPSQPIKVLPNEHIKVDLAINKNDYKISTNLKQEIYGEITAKISTNYQKKILTISIKEAMQILQRYNLLPNEININKKEIV